MSKGAAERRERVRIGRVEVQEAVERSLRAAVGTRHVVQKLIASALAAHRTADWMATVTPTPDKRLNDYLLLCPQRLFSSHWIVSRHSLAGVHVEVSTDTGGGTSTVRLADHQPPPRKRRP